MRLATLSLVLCVVLMPALSPRHARAEAENLLKNPGAEAGDTPEGWTGTLTVSPDQPHEGTRSFSVTGMQAIRSTDFIEVNADTVYHIRGWFRSAGAKGSRVYFGFDLYDADKKPIAPLDVNPLPGTDTTLAEPCVKTDTVIKVADASAWKVGPLGAVAFDTDDSGSYTDLPNRRHGGKGIVKIENMQTHWEVHLNRACGQEFAAGAKVRQHESGPSSIYNPAKNVAVPETWTVYEGKVGGMTRIGVSESKWWRGTRYVRVLILANWNQPKDDPAVLQFDDIAVTDVAPANP